MDVCFAYKQEKGKLDSRCEQGVFVGYDKNSPTYLVNYPDTKRVQKHRLAKFPTKAATERETQTPESQIECSDSEVHPKVNMEENVDECVENKTRSGCSKWCLPSHLQEMVLQL